MNIWLGSDWHLFYEYGEDSGINLKNSNADNILAYYRANVKDDDVVIYLGDLTNRNFKDLTKLKELIGVLPGYKILIKGNHDTQDDSFYSELGFATICDTAVYKNIIFTHKPCFIDDKYINIHGHLHGEKYVETKPHEHIDVYPATKRGCLVTLKDILNKNSLTNNANKKYKHSCNSFKQSDEIVIDLEQLFDDLNFSDIETGLNESVNMDLFKRSRILACNIDKFRNGTNNILYVTGLSGSGKSTLSSKIYNELVNEKKRVTIVHLDDFEFYEKDKSEIITRYYNTFKDVQKYLDDKWEGVSLDVYTKEFIKFFKWLKLELHKTHGVKYIVEGVQIMFFIKPKKISELTLIVLDSSWYKLYTQRLVRSVKSSDDIIQTIGNVNHFISNYHDLYNSADLDSSIIKNFIDGISTKNITTVGSDNIVVENVSTVGINKLLYSAANDDYIKYDFNIIYDGNINESFLPFAKSFYVKFNRNGDVTISRREYKDFDTVLKESARMLKLYDKAKNYDDMMYELCRIYYAIRIIEKYYLQAKSIDKVVRKEMLDLRSVMLNTFNHYYKIVAANTENKNFMKYFEQTKFGSDLKIPKETITLLGKTIKTMLV